MATACLGENVGSASRRLCLGKSRPREETEEGLGFRGKAVFDITQVEKKDEEGQRRRESSGNGEEEMQEEARAKLPMLPYIPEGREQWYREAIEQLARQLAWTSTSSEAVALFEHRAA